MSKVKMVCPNCETSGSIRIILYGLPESEPNPHKYVVGGCCISPYGNDPELRCITCNWQGNKKELTKTNTGKQND